MMSPDIVQGVAAELTFALAEGSTFAQEPHRFVVRPPPGSHTLTDFQELLRSEVRRIARFVAYGHFVSIERHADGSYTVLSHSDSGGAFELLFATGAGSDPARLSP